MLYADFYYYYFPYLKAKSCVLVVNVLLIYLYCPQNFLKMSSKVKCKYWEKCYRRDATHLAEFLHPADVKGKDSKKEDKGMDIMFLSFIHQVQ